MSTSKHTPGPWHLVGECIIDGSIEIISSHPEAPAYEWAFVASVYHHTDKDEDDTNTFTKEIAEANARLIAAAPDLLEACIFALSLQKSQGMVDASEKLNVKKLEAAIAKTRK